MPFPTGTSCGVKVTVGKAFGGKHIADDDAPCSAEAKKRLLEALHLARYTSRRDDRVRSLGFADEEARVRPQCPIEMELDPLSVN